jgi:tetratricopeptide (TPR) repeat protein
MSPEQLLERLTARLDLLKGDRDVEPRQRTLLATIDWSHDLLDPDEHALFRRLSVFVGGCTLEAAEAVCEVDPELLEALVDKSLVQWRDDEPEPRFWMLEVIRDYAVARLEAAGEQAAFHERHANFYCALAKRMDAAVRAGEPEEGPVAVLAADINNIRAAVDFALEVRRIDLAREIAASLEMYWTMRGLYAEARFWLERALALDDEKDDVRRRLLSALALIAYSQGDHALAVEASDEAARLAMQLGGVTETFELLKEQAVAALIKDDLDSAEDFFREALRVAIAVDNGVGTSACRLNIAYIANKTARHGLADTLLGENLQFVRGKGQTRCEAHTLGGLAETSLYLDKPLERADDALLGARRALQIDDKPTAAYCLDVWAAAAATGGDGRRVVTILGATEAAREAMGVGPDEDELSIRQRALKLVEGDAPDLEGARVEGRELDLEGALALASRLGTP